MFVVTEADKTFGDPPWLRAINQTEELVRELDNLHRAIVSDEPDPGFPIAGRAVRAAHVELKKLLDQAFWERTTGWWKNAAPP